MIPLEPQILRVNLSTGNVLGFACELFEKGIISSRDTGGVAIRWGDHRGFVKLVEQIAYRRGFGDLLAEGVKLAAEKLGNNASEYAMHVKGLELPAYDPRAIKGYALSYATSNIGGSHMYGRPREELYGTGPQAIDRNSEEGKGHLIAAAQIKQAADEVGKRLD